MVEQQKCRLPVEILLASLSCLALFLSSLAVFIPQKALCLGQGLRPLLGSSGGAAAPGGGSVKNVFATEKITRKL